MKRILFISYLFAPRNEIGALRPTKIVKKLCERGYIVDVVSEGGGTDCSLEVPKGIRNWFVKTKIKNMPQTNLKSIKSRRKYIPIWLKRTYRILKSNKCRKEFLKFFKELYNTQLKYNNYDVVITSFGPLASLECGLYIKKQQPNIKWICDFRDPVVTDITPFLFRRKWAKLQAKACRQADSIVAVSNGYIDRICGNKHKEKRYMIPNGYELEDLPNVELKTSESIKLRFTYVGALYEGRRKITPIFKAISELIAEGKMDSNKIEFHYAGSEFNVLFNQAKAWNMEYILQNHGRIPRVDSLELQKVSHILVLSTWNEKGEEGVFPGKFLEYMLIRKPIISITDGNLANSEVTQVINEGGLGVAYESINDKKDFQVLKEYLYGQYGSFNRTKRIQFNPSGTLIDSYNWDKLIFKIEGLF